MRSPYSTDGRSYRPDAISYEESEDEARDNLVWGNPAYTLAARLIDSFAKHRWFTATYGAEGGGLVTGLPTRDFTSSNGHLTPKCPTEIPVSDATYNSLADLGFTVLVHCDNTDYGAFLSTNTCYKPPDNEPKQGEQEAQLPTDLESILAASRFAHYLKAIVRDKIGLAMEAKELAELLNSWINGYISRRDSLSLEARALRPLRGARIEVTPIPGRPGYFSAVAELRFHSRQKSAHSSRPDSAHSVRLEAELYQSRIVCEYKRQKYEGDLSGEIYEEHDFLRNIC
jgi:type VI secretion system protein ImpC